MKVAIVYDRVNKWGGAERVLLALHKIYPKAHLFTSVYDSRSASWAKVFPKIHTSFLQKVPFAKRNHEYLAPLMPIAFSFFDFAGYDLVISVTSEFAKNIKTPKDALHVCYCLTPTRYLWSGYKNYFSNSFYRFFTKPIVFLLRLIDFNAAQKPDIIIGISSAVKKRIKKYYKRNSLVIFPPVDVRSKKAKKRRHYLLVSRLDYGYKKVDLAIRSFNNLKRELVIVGTGRQTIHLKKLAHKNIKFVGKVTDEKLIDYYRSATALIMPQDEDFGIVAIEAQGYGCPVIAYGAGGALDTVIDKKTGIFFKEQTEKSLEAAVLRFEKMRFKEDNLVTNAKKFSIKNFKLKFVRIVQDEIKRRRI